jgi:hypothetical protein
VSIYTDSTLTTILERSGFEHRTPRPVELMRTRHSL